MAEYLRQNCSLTLTEGLNEFYSINPQLNLKFSNSEASDLIKNHDAIHVVFGCTTELKDEVLADCWTIFGTKFSLKEYVSLLKMDEIKEIVMQPGIPATIGAFVVATPKILRLIFIARGMTKKWDLSDRDRYLDTPLNVIREEFNIKVLSRAS